MAIEAEEAGSLNDNLNSFALNRDSSRISTILAPPSATSAGTLPSPMTSAKKIPPLNVHGDLSSLPPPTSTITPTISSTSSASRSPRSPPGNRFGNESHQQQRAPRPNPATPVSPRDMSHTNAVCASTSSSPTSSGGLGRPPGTLKTPASRLGNQNMKAGSMISLRSGSDNSNTSGSGLSRPHMRRSVTLAGGQVPGLAKPPPPPLPAANPSSEKDKTLHSLLQSSLSVNNITYEARSNRAQTGGSNLRTMGAPPGALPPPIPSSEIGAFVPPNVNGNVEKLVVRVVRQVEHDGLRKSEVKTMRIMRDTTAQMMLTSVNRKLNLPAGTCEILVDCGTEKIIVDGNMLLFDILLKQPVYLKTPTQVGSTDQYCRKHFYLL